MEHTTETPKQYQCRHIFTDGRRCASPCLRQEEFCYYHHTTRKPVANPEQRRRRCSTFHLPLPEDRSAIQASIGEVLQRIASNDIAPRRAGLLLYGLQIASLNLPKPQAQSKVKPETETVEEITIDPTLGILAPRTELSALAKPKSAVTQLIESILRSEKEKEKAVNPGINEVAAVPVIVPILQATEGDPDSAVPLNPTPKNVNASSKDVISTEGGALAAAVEKSAFSTSTGRIFCLSFRTLSVVERGRNLLLPVPLSVLLNATPKQKLSFRPEVDALNRPADAHS